MEMCSLYNLWNTAFERFFCPQTGLFYEFVTDDSAKAWDNLPTALEIKNSYPNPCGWGTGMEDSVMNGTVAIDALLFYGKNEDIQKLVYSLADGVLKCGEAGESDGFVARSVLPYDGKSHYIESSRDQYTHFVYSLTRYYFSDHCEKNIKERIRQAIVAVAEKCKHDVTAHNDFNMLREDKSVGLVNKMWGDIGAHEYLRLPMFYLAAYKISGNDEYFSLYRKYVDEAIENSLAFNEKASRLYCSLQMMCSLKFVYDYDEDEKVKEKLLPLMKRLALYGEDKAVNNSIEFSKKEHRSELDYAFKSWRQVNMRDGGYFNGYRYLNPAQSELRENVAFYPVREVGEGAILASMCPEKRVSSHLINAVLTMANAIDVKKQSSVYPLLYLPCAYALCIENIDKTAID